MCLLGGGTPLFREVNKKFLVLKQKRGLNHQSINMKGHHTLICFFFFTVLQDGNIGLINAQIPIFRGTEGQSITVPCNFTRTGDRRYFCKHKSEDRFSPALFNDCDGEERILEMKDDSIQRGRYSMRYKTTHTGSHLYVTITHLTKSDSGVYGCCLDIPLSIDPYQKFKIIVTDALSTSTPKITTRPFLTSASTKTPSPPPPPTTPPTTTTTTTTTTQSFRRSSTPSTFSKTTNQSGQEQTEKTTTGSSGLLLYVGLTLVIIVLLSSVAVLILCKKRASKPKEHPEETECDNVTEANRMYEEIREGDGQSRSPPVENSAEASTIYSVVTAAASLPLSKTEDLNELDYTEVDFSNRAATSLSSAPSGQVANVIYSTLQTHTDAKVESQPLYSTVTLPQQ